MIIGPSVAAVAVAILFALTVSYLQEIAHVKTLNSQSGDNQLVNNQLPALLQSMQAAREVRYDWRLHALPNRNLSAGVLVKLRLAIEKTTEVGRYPFNRLGLAAGPCAVAFNAQDQLRFVSIGVTSASSPAASGTWDGRKVPDLFANQSLVTCEPVSGRFVAAVNRAIPTTWRDGSAAVIRPAALNDPSIPGRSGGIDAVGASPTGNMLAFLRGGSLILFDLNTSQVVQRLTVEPAPNRPTNPIVVFSPDGSLVLEAVQAIKIWNVRSGQLLLDQRAGAPIRGVQFGANAVGQFLAVASSGNGSGGVELRKLSDANASTVQYQYPQRAPAQLAINGPGTMLAIGSMDGSIDIWRIPPDLTADSWAGAPNAWKMLSDLHASTAPIEALGFSPDSKYLATASFKEDAEGRTVESNVRVWEVDLAAQKAAAKGANLNQLFQMGCRRLQVYLDVMAGTAGPVKDVDLKSLQAGCKAALGPGTGSGR
jgi:WD40 repeat protein